MSCKRREGYGQLWPKPSLAKRTLATSTIFGQIDQNQCFHVLNQFLLFFFFVLFILFVFLAHLFSFFLFFFLFFSFSSFLFFFFFVFLLFCFLPDTPPQDNPPRTAPPSPGPPSPGPPSPGPPSDGRPSDGLPKMSLFSLSRHMFLSFFPLLGVFSWNFGGVLKTGHVWALGLSCGFGGREEVDLVIELFHSSPKPFQQHQRSSKRKLVA